MIFMDKKNYTHVFSHNKKLKALPEVKENNVAVNWLMIKSCQIYKNINHRTQLLKMHITDQIHNL